MSKIVKFALVGAASILLSACALNNQAIGSLTGGALGGVLGNQVGRGNGRVIATIGGTLLGAYLGNQVGASMDETDRLAMERNVQTSMSDNRAIAWRGNKGSRYKVVPSRKTYRRSGERCRNYTMDAYMGGERRQVHGRACYRGGRWVNVS